MTFYIVHELIRLADGHGGRIRLRANLAFTAARANDLNHALANISGIEGVQVNPRSGSVLLFYADAESRTAVLRLLAVADTLPARREEGAVVEAEARPKSPFWPLMRFFVVRPFLPTLWRVVTAVWAAVPFLVKGLQSLARGRINVDVLDASAILASLLLRDFRTVSVLTLLLGLGDILAAWTRYHSLNTLAESLSLNVQNVWLLRDGKEVLAPIEEVAVGDLVVLAAGSSIPVDGVVEDGVAVVNQATMTGEPQGVAREKGGAVFAGTVVEEGRIVVRVTKQGDDTRYRQVAAFIEESESFKASIQGKSERLADMAVPFTFALAALVWIFTRDFRRVAAVLLVDYSCALKLATPLAVLAAMREGAHQGIIIKGGRYLEALNEADTVVFDKTGTLTGACPQVAEVIPVRGRKRDDILRIMACLEEHFPHPVARAVVNRASQENLQHEEEHAQVEYVVAHGVASYLHGKRLLVGSRHYLEHDEGVDLAPLAKAIAKQSALGRSLLYLAEDGKAAGMLAIEDPLRPEATEVVASLREMGFNRVLMLTGDDERTAKAIADRVGITEFRAQILPTDKAGIVQELTAQGCKVLMVGDGINDAPALSASHVGIAMIDGTALAREVANVLLTRSDLHGILTARQLARGTLKRIHTNFTATLILNSLFLVGGLTMLLPPGLSALLHNLTTLGVSLNAMRPHLNRHTHPEQAA